MAITISKHKRKLEMHFSSLAGITVNFILLFSSLQIERKKKFKRLRRLDDDESGDERGEDEGEEREIIANTLFDGSDDVSLYLCISLSSRLQRFAAACCTSPSCRWPLFLGTRIWS